MKVSTCCDREAQKLQPWQIPVPVEYGADLSGSPAAKLIPEQPCPGASKPEACPLDPASCGFLAGYWAQLEKLDRTEVEASLAEYCRRVAPFCEPDRKLEAVLLVSQPPRCPCSQRGAIQALLGCRELSFKRKRTREDGHD